MATGAKQSSTRSGCAWREHVADNRRDARLMAACGAGGVVAGALAWYALALVLVFIGTKIFLVGIIGKIPPVVSLSVTFA